MLNSAYSALCTHSISLRASVFFSKQKIPVNGTLQSMKRLGTLPENLSVTSHCQCHKQYAVRTVAYLWAKPKIRHGRVTAIGLLQILI